MKESRVALISGGSRGIGKAICLALAESGYSIVFTYLRNELAASSLRRRLMKSGVKVISFRQDCSDTKAVEALVTDLFKKFGHIDVLVNNAGIVADQPLFLMTENEWDDVIRINLKGAYNFCRACIPNMMRRRHGHIINIASVSGFNGVAGQTNYSASKGALIAFSKSLAREVGRFGITVNAIAPGIIETDMIRSLSADSKRSYISRIPLGHFGKSEDVGKLVRFLVEDSSYITGQVLVVDGGLST